MDGVHGADRCTPTCLLWLLSSVFLPYWQGLWSIFFYTNSNSPRCNGMHGMVTMVIEVDQKKNLDQGQQCHPRESQLSRRTQWRFCYKLGCDKRVVQVTEYQFFYLWTVFDYFFPVCGSIFGLWSYLMINWLVPPTETNDSLANRRERWQALLHGFTLPRV